MRREDVIRQIVERDVQGQGLTETVVRDQMPELYDAACALFGTWDTALQYAGVTRRRLGAAGDYSPEGVLQMIRNCCIRGCSIRAEEMMHRRRRLYEEALRYFGTWRSALRAAGVNVERANLRSRPRHHNKPKIIAALRERHRRGQSLRWTVICLEDRALATAARSAFDSLRKALVAAGIISASEPNRRNTKWSREAVIAAIVGRQARGLSLKCKIVKAEGGGLVTAAQRYCGCWRAALEAAGVVAPREPTQAPS